MKEPKTSQEKFDFALELEKNDRFEEALRYLQDIRQQEPFSELAIQAEWKMAEIYFKQENYPLAASSFEKFYQQYPSHPQASESLFMQALSLEKQVPDNPQRDLSQALPAIARFDQYVAQFPQGPRVAEAKKEKKGSKTS